MKNSLHQAATSVARFQVKASQRWVASVLGVFLIVLSGWALVMHNRQQDTLLSTIPVSSMLYIHAHQQTVPWQQYHLALSPLRPLFDQLDTELGFSQSLSTAVLPQAAEVAVAVVPNQAGLERVLLVRLKPISWLTTQVAAAANDQARTVIINQPYVSQLTEDTYAVATTAEGLEQVVQTKAGKLFSLESQLDKRVFTNTIGAYLDVEGLSMHTESNLLRTGMSNQPIYLTANPRSNFWRVRLSGPALNFLTARAPKLDTVPSNFLVLVSGSNIAKLFNHWATIDQRISSIADQLTSGAALQGNTELLQGLAALDHPGSLVISPTTSDSLLGFNFQLTVPSADQLALFESLVSYFLAHQLPAAVNRQLPDGSRVTELVASTSTFNWQTYLTARYVTTPTKVPAIAYVNTEKSLTIANATSTLSNIDAPLVSVKDLKRCRTGDRFIIINVQALGQYLSATTTQYLPAGKLVLEPAQKGVKGCFY